MRRIPSFVYGHVIGALIAGIAGGAFLDLTAVMVFGAGLAAAAIVSAMVCWWWPKFDAAAWKLWLVATLANPVMLAGSINNIQVSWVKLNRKLSQLCLHAGANDYGGTLMEENISREAGATAGQYTSPEDFQALILEAGRIPAERNTTYSRIHIKLPLDEFSAEQSLEAEFA